MEVECMKFMFPSLFLLTFLCVKAFAGPSPGDPACILDFSTFPYRPLGVCRNAQEKLKDRYGFPRTTCCQNALLTFSHALALHALNDSFGNIFLQRDEWNNCSGPFNPQPSVSAQSCGFDNFYYGSGNCSTLHLSYIDSNVVEQCSHFSSSSFDDACRDCTNAILTALDHMVIDQKTEVSDDDKAVCLVAVLVTVIAGNMNNASVIDRCLPALSLPDPVNCINLNTNVAGAFPVVILIMIGLAMGIALIKFVTENQKQKKKPLTNKDFAASCSGLYRFSKAEIEKAINYGNEKNYLGRGNAGQVFKGMMPSGQLVAIKQIYMSNKSDSFTREIERLSSFRHPNLACLFGCCIEDGKQYLVYEYCSNGNLAQNLLRKDTVLTWDLRVKILRDCALALNYLHNHVDGCIIHGNIKLTNILLNHNMEPKLSDFRLGKILGMEGSNVFIDVRASLIGYIDPEYMSSGKLTSASDIYSFGIATLQLLSGLRVISLDHNARDQLRTKAKEVAMRKRPSTDFQDPRMKGDVVDVDFQSILQIAVLCVASSRAGRPTIDLVCDELETALKNTQLEMRARNERSLLAAPSNSLTDLL